MIVDLRVLRAVHARHHATREHRGANDEADDADDHEAEDGFVAGEVAGRELHVLLSHTNNAQRTSGLKGMLSQKGMPTNFTSNE